MALAKEVLLTIWTLANILGIMARIGETWVISQNRKNCTGSLILALDFWIRYSWQRCLKVKITLELYYYNSNSNMLFVFIFSLLLRKSKDIPTLLVSTCSNEEWLREGILKTAKKRHVVKTSREIYTTCWFVTEGQNACSGYWNMAFQLGRGLDTSKSFKILRNKIQFMFTTFDSSLDHLLAEIAK